TSVFGSATGQGVPTMSLQTSPAPSTGRRAIDLQSIDLSGIDHRRLERSKFAGRFAQNGIMLSLVHLDVALAVKVQYCNANESTDEVPCFKVSAKRLAHRSDDAGRVSAAIKHEDPIMRRLSDALAATE